MAKTHKRDKASRSDRDLDTILNPDSWPMMALPLKHSQAQGHHFPVLAILTHSPDGVYRLYAGDRVNAYIPTTWSGLSPIATYTRDTIDELLAAGWRVG